MGQQHPSQARVALERGLWNTVIEMQRTRNGSTESGEAIIEIELVLAALATIAARVVMLGDGASRRMKFAAGFDTRFLDEHRGRELALHSA